jgi:hypothetical protein
LETRKLLGDGEIIASDRERVHACNQSAAIASIQCHCACGLGYVFFPPSFSLLR